MNAKLKDIVQGLDIVRLPEVLETVNTRLQLRLLLGDELGMRQAEHGNELVGSR